MPLRTRAAAALLAGVTAISVVGVAAPASAAAPPAISWSFVTNEIDAGTQPTLSYAVAHVPAGGKAVLQRQAGTAGGWHTITFLHPVHGKGAFTAPAVGQGAYSYRIVITDKKGHGLIGKVGYLYSYANVTLDTFGYSSYTVNISGRLFRYMSDEGMYPGETYDLLKLDDLTCRSIHLDLADSYDGTSSVSTTVSVSTENADPFSAGVPSNGFATLDGSVDGSSTVEIDGLGAGDWSHVYINGSMSCFTPTGRSSS